jgi:hypothetical protein
VALTFFRMQQVAAELRSAGQPRRLSLH